MKLPNEDFRKLVKSTRDPEFKKEIYEAQEQRKIDWPAYNLSQIKQVKETLNFIREIVNNSYAPKVRSNATNPRDLAKAILISEMIQSPERESEGWVEILGPYVGIHTKIDDWILGNGYSRPEVAMILYEIFLTTRDSDRILQGDGTGLERTRKQNYESQKKGDCSSI
jgi:transposase